MNESAMCLLRALDADKRAQGFVQSKLGRRRWFLSQADADAYDRGWSTYPYPEAPAGEGPFRNGQLDAFSHEEAKHEWNDDKVWESEDEL